MRHLYAASSEPGVSYLIDKAKTYERRRCGHLPADYPEPLSTETCLTTVVDPKGSKTNKHRYVVASQDVETRKAMRGILGVPLVYINRSVMIMEPMAGATAENREREERKKFRDGLKRGSGSLKRKREEEEGEGGAGKASEKRGAQEQGQGQERSGDDPKKKKRNVRGVKGPNPLSVKKATKTKTVTKPEATKSGESAVQKERKIATSASGDTAADEGVEATTSEPTTKRRRRRKHKPEAEAAGAGTGTGEAAGEAANGGDSE